MSWRNYQLEIDELENSNRKLKWGIAGTSILGAGGISFGVGSKPLKDKLVESMNKGSEEKKNQSDNQTSPMVEKKRRITKKA